MTNNDDIEYYKNLITIEMSKGNDTTKLQKQLELLEDAYAIYRLTQPARSK